MNDITIKSNYRIRYAAWAQQSTIDLFKYIIFLIYFSLYFRRAFFYLTADDPSHHSESLNRRRRAAPPAVCIIKADVADPCSYSY